MSRLSPQVTALTLALEAGCEALAIDLLDRGARMHACPRGALPPLLLAEARGLGGAVRAMRARR